LLQENKAKVESELNEKLRKKIISDNYAKQFKKAFEEILSYNF